ncbi:hypothetical protein [Paraburkholderia caribensis]|uniref:hypothetical protein n=1 Tax=Paraburkholderia caribensis TaxID=75105 RepID=UPI0007223484|nr:hypothetical protein [Paraburkholderia caribensis]ALP68514.1 hypothetical protein AN416_37935 [Paraburkholderia caribensis]AUT57869.1 hypothetical protein C2L66_38910 [Paraburkholderia caribensis]
MNHGFTLTDVGIDYSSHAALPLKSRLRATARDGSCLKPFALLSIVDIALLATVSILSFRIGARQHQHALRPHQL